MTLLGDLQNVNLFRANYGATCTVCEFVANLTPEEAAAFDHLLGDPKVAAAAISRVLQRNDIDLKAGVISRHRRKECRGFSR